MSLKKRLLFYSLGNKTLGSEFNMWHNPSKDDSAPWVNFQGKGFSKIAKAKILIRSVRKKAIRLWVFWPEWFSQQRSHYLKPILYHSSCTVPTSLPLIWTHLHRYMTQRPCLSFLFLDRTLIFEKVSFLLIFRFSIYGIKNCKQVW